MLLVVHKTSRLCGQVMVPASKSHSIRGMFFALLAQGQSILSNVLDSDDTQDALRVCQALGAQIDWQNHHLTLTSDGSLFTATQDINTGNSGITTRFLLPILGLRQNHMTPIRIHCNHQMQERPIKPLLDALRTLGMKIQSLEQADRLPVMVSGELKGGQVEIDGTTSQYLSALLISLPLVQENSVITVKHLNERPYVEMTLTWLKEQNIKYRHHNIEDTDIFYIQGGQSYQPFQTSIKGDFSSASCLLAAAALLPGDIELHGLDMCDPQGDKQLLTILQKMGADIRIEPNKIKIKGNQPLTGMPVDANTIPDLVPALAVIATQAKAKTHIYHVAQARLKETDRIHSMTEGLRRMGARIEEHADGMTIYPSALHGATVKGYGDHRTVMALTVAGLIAEGKTLISEGSAITKTYPAFIEVMAALGADLALQTAASNLPPVCVSRHLILIGFKHTGKSLIGKQLAQILNKSFIDLDDEIEQEYEKEHAQFLSCRDIMLYHGESYFRTQETHALQRVLAASPCVIALGGGTPLHHVNRDLIKAHDILHITAAPHIVFERMMATGRPAFFNPHEDPALTFKRLWRERNKIYQHLTPDIVDNSTTPESALSQAMCWIHNHAKRTCIRVTPPLRHTGDYPILIGHSILHITNCLPEKKFSRIVIITDHLVKKRYGLLLKKQLREAGSRVLLYAFQAGEQSKTEETKQAIEHFMHKSHCDRDTLMIALGGGVVGDLAGFVAATFLRGIAYIQIPTSLLAMVDSSIGGKTGINTPYGKNLIGSIYPPQAVIIDLSLLKTLPEKHLINGLIEAIKMFLTHDAHSFNYISQHLDAIIQGDERLLHDIITRAIRIKADVVSRDEQEQGERSLLNFGHTIGHALEKISHYTLLHGEAVGYGILIESGISHRMGLLSSEQLSNIKHILARLNIHGKDLVHYNLEQCIQATRTDKKTRAGQPRYVLLRDIGHAHYIEDQFTHPVADRIVKQVWKTY